MTFNEFANRCTAFEYSQEFYELLKEELELSLMEQYIESVRFMESNPDVVDPFGSGYFIESADINVEKLLEAVQQKKEGLLKRFWNGVQKVFRAIINFFKRLIAKLRGDESKAKSASDKADQDLSSGDQKRIMFIKRCATAGVAAAAAAGITFVGVKGVKKAISITRANSYLNDAEKAILDCINYHGVLSDDMYYAVLVNMPVIDMTKAEEYAELDQQSVNKLAQNRWGSIRALKDYVVSSKGDNGTGYILQIGSPQTCQEVIDALTDLMNQIKSNTEEFISDTKHELKSQEFNKKEYNAAKKSNQNDFKSIRSDVADLNQIVGNTIKCYNLVIKIMDDCINNINNSGDVMNDEMSDSNQ